MKQQDYDQQYFAPRPQHMSRQSQQQMQLPPQPQQQMYMQMPQQTMPGGNYAPAGMPLNQQGNGMFGQPMVAAGMTPYVGPQHPGNGQQQRSPLPDYTALQNEWNSTNKDIRKLVSEDDAIENMEEMKKLVDKINGSAEGSDPTVAAGNIGHVVMLIDQVLKCLTNPMDWLPPSRAKYAEKLVAGGTPIANALKKYSTQIEKLKVQ